MTCARAEEPLPDQEQAVTRALENHPDILAAKSKVALAEAELYGKRMDVSRQVLGLFGNLKNLETQIEVQKTKLSSAQSSYDRLAQAVKQNAVSAAEVEAAAAEVQAARSRILQAMAQREQGEKELRLLIGKSLPMVEAKSQANAVAAPQQMPQGPILDKVGIALTKPIKLEFNEVPLPAAIDFIAETTGVRFSVQRPAFESLGLNDAMSVSLRTSEVSLRAALQAFEDAYPDLQFVIRDYGILLSTKDYAKEHGFMPVLELPPR